MPGFAPSSGFVGGPLSPRTFYAPYQQPSKYKITGVTRDVNGNALGGCTVEAYETVSSLFRQDGVSDANGNYSLEVTGGQGLTFYVVAYKAGSPDVAGTTVNTLVGSWSS